jgi:hypothetical protein
MISVATMISLAFFYSKSWEILGLFRKKQAQRAQFRHNFGGYGKLPKKPRSLNWSGFFIAKLAYLQYW